MQVVPRGQKAACTWNHTQPGSQEPGAARDESHSCQKHAPPIEDRIHIPGFKISAQIRAFQGRDAVYVNELNDNQYQMNFNPSALQQVAAVSVTDGKCCCRYLGGETALSAPTENQGQ